VLKASLNRLPGDALRRLLFESVGTSNAKLDCVGRLERRSSWFDSDPVALGPLIADSTSACEPSVSAASTELVLINGEDDV
jgi:hypothetical protein